MLDRAGTDTGEGFPEPVFAVSRNRGGQVSVRFRLKSRSKEGIDHSCKVVSRCACQRTGWYGRNQLENLSR